MNNEKLERIYKIVMLIFIVALITFCGTTMFMYNKFTDNGATKYVFLSSGDSSVGTAINRVKSILSKMYLKYDEVNEKNLVEGAVKGYVNAIGDEYTEYMTEEEWKLYQEKALGNYIGVGLYLSVLKETNEIVVLAPIPESVSEKAGVKSGDIIKKINGEEYNGDRLNEAVELMHGNEGDIVDIEMLRENESINFKLTIGPIRTFPITIEMLENNIGYIKLISFDEGIVEDFKNKYQDLLNQGAKSIILDVRTNGGGYIQGATGILDMLLPKDKELVTIRYRNGEENVMKSENDPIFNLPMVIIQNSYSASATEILAGALKDYEYAKIVGTKSFGKGIMQNVYSIDKAALKVTTAEFYTPKRTTIHKVGIEPDYNVEIDEKYASLMYIPKEEDTQLKKAIEILSVN